MKSTLVIFLPVVDVVVAPFPLVAGDLDRHLRALRCTPCRSDASVAGQARRIRMTIGTTVQTISAWCCATTARPPRPCDLRKRNMAHEHRAEHEDADDDADTQREHVQRSRRGATDVVTPGVMFSCHGSGLAIATPPNLQGAMRLTQLSLDCQADAPDVIRVTFDRTYLRRCSLNSASNTLSFLQFGALLSAMKAPISVPAMRRRSKRALPLPVRHCTVPSKSGNAQLADLAVDCTSSDDSSRMMRSRGRRPVSPRPESKATRRLDQSERGVNTAPARPNPAVVCRATNTAITRRKSPRTQRAIGLGHIVAQAPAAAVEARSWGSGVPGTPE